MVIETGTFTRRTPATDGRCKILVAVPNGLERVFRGLLIKYTDIMHWERVHGLANQQTVTAYI